jgi:hypothetical protein
LLTNADHSVEARRTFNAALGQNLDESTISVCLASARIPSVEHESQRLEATQPLADRFRGILKEFCTGQARSHKRTQAYSIDQEPNAEFVQYVSLEEYPEVRQRISELYEPGALSNFRNEEIFVKRLRFHAIVSQLESGRTLIGLRNVTLAQKPGVSQWTVRAIWDEMRGRYDLLERDPFLFDEGVDCFVYGEFVFVVNRSKFEKIFNFDQVTRDVAQRALARLESFSISNFDEFRRACLRDRRKQGMLAPMSREDADMSHVNVETAREVIATNANLSSIISTVNGNEVLTFDLDSGNQWHLLRFLKQTTVRAVATGNPFEVDGGMNPL